MRKLQRLIITICFVGTPAYASEPIEILLAVSATAAAEGANPAGVRRLGSGSNGMSNETHSVTEPCLRASLRMSLRFWRDIELTLPDSSLYA